MRVAVSGTHCCGKTTLIDEFLLAHPHFAHESEPYTVLEEDYGEAFAAEPSPDDFYRQLEFNLERLRRYPPGSRVVFERSPVDFLAYLFALSDLRRGEGATQLIERSRAIVLDAIQHLDLIVFLPINDNDDIVMSDSEDPELREAVNRRLVDMFTFGDLNLFTTDRPLVLEAMGSTTERLRTLERAVQNQLAEGGAR